LGVKMVDREGLDATEVTQCHLAVQRARIREGSNPTPSPSMELEPDGYWKRNGGS
jgi:hypothetical protein